MRYNKKLLIIAFQKALAKTLAILCGITIFILLMVGIVWGGEEGYELITDYYHHYTYQEVSDSVDIQYYPSRETYRLYNTETERFLTPHYDHIYGCREGVELTVIVENGKYGFIDTSTGEVVIEPQYINATHFEQGIAAVTIDEAHAVFINRHNERLFEEEIGCQITELPTFERSAWKVRNSEGLMGVLDKQGKWILEPIYDDIDLNTIEGYIGVSQNDKWGVVTTEGVTYYPIAYDRITAAYCDDGFVLTKQGLRWEEDLQRRVVRPFIYDHASELEYKSSVEDSESECYTYALSDFAYFNIDNHKGLFNRLTGEVILPAICDNIYMISESLIEAYIEGQWQTFDTNGEPIEP